MLRFCPGCRRLHQSLEPQFPTGPRPPRVISVRLAGDVRDLSLQTPGPGAVSDPFLPLPWSRSHSECVLVLGWRFVLCSLFRGCVRSSSCMQPSAVSVKSGLDEPAGDVGLSCTHVVPFLRPDSKAGQERNHVI